MTLVRMIIFSCFVLFDVALGATELLKNHDMEMVHLGGSWVCKGSCSLASSTDHFSGYHSIKVFNRFVIFWFDFYISLLYSKSRYIRLYIINKHNLFNNFRLILLSDMGH